MIFFWKFSITLVWKQGQTQPLKTSEAAYIGQNISVYDVIINVWMRFSEIVLFLMRWLETLIYDVFLNLFYEILRGAVPLNEFKTLFYVVGEKVQWLKSVHHKQTLLENIRCGENRCLCQNMTNEMKAKYNWEKKHSIRIKHKINLFK